MTNDELVRSFYEPFRTGDATIYEAILDEHWVDVPLTPGQQQGPGGMAAHIDGFRRVFPDYDVTNEEVVVGGDLVAVRNTVTGTHLGAAFMGHQPSGRRIAIRTMDMHQVRDGRIVTTWHLEDFDGLAAQLADPGAGLGVTGAGATAVTGAPRPASPVAAGGAAGAAPPRRSRPRPRTPGSWPART